MDAQVEATFPKVASFVFELTYDDLPDWIRSVVTGHVQGQRLTDAGMTSSELHHLTARVPFDG